ncbi:AMP-dependent synthetase/ligase [Streptacidiphilus monticola]|uniref:Acyl-CoA synthetase n=1 Tax=Streptacidiphilus monticola TaxID=2161674 RepID=A0ABW1G067_9ACTN
MRQYSVPALASPAPGEGLAESVFARAEAEPGRPVLRRRRGGSGAPGAAAPVPPSRPSGPAASGTDASAAPPAPSSSSPAAAPASPDEWIDVTAAEFRDQVLALAKGLLHQGIRFGDRVALMSRTRYEWTLIDYALWTIGAVPVPVYPTASAAQLQWILADSQAVACFVEHEDHAMTVGSVCDRLPALRRIWQLSPSYSDIRTETEGSAPAPLSTTTGAGTHAADPGNPTGPAGFAEHIDASSAPSGILRELALAGRQVDDELIRRHRAAITASTLATVIYTSGTTGRPKGCPLTHGNFIAETDNLIARYPEVFRARDGGQASSLLFLPLAHVFARMAQVASLRAGIVLGHQGDLRPEVLMPAFRSFRPTFVAAVPHIFEKLAARGRQAAEEAGRGSVFDRAWDVAVRYGEALERRAFGEGSGPSPALRIQHQLYEQLVYGKVRAALGGRIRHAMSGGSGMDRELGLFFLGAGVTIFEGYGLTETTAALTANPPEAQRFGTVGLPIPGTEITVAADGEVWARGPQVFTGYLGEQAPALSPDGWLPTGDLGRLDEHGYLTITGRKKEIIVTSNGKSVAPAVLEERLRTHPLIAHCLLVGDDRPFVGALITLDPEALAHWQRSRGKPLLPPAEARQDPDLQVELQRAVSTANAAVSRAESIRSFRILGIDFGAVPELVTPSLKLRRKAIVRHCAADIDALYAGPAPAPPAASASPSA